MIINVKMVLTIRARYVQMLHVFFTYMLLISLIFILVVKTTAKRSRIRISPKLVFASCV